MTINDAEKVKKKLDAVISAADEYGTQAAQLNRAQKEIHSCAEALSASAEKLDEQIAASETYSTALKATLEETISATLIPNVEKTTELLKLTRDQSQEIIAEYQTVLKEMEQKKSELEQEHGKFVLAVEASERELQEKIDLLGEKWNQDNQTQTQSLQKISTEQLDAFKVSQENYEKEISARTEKIENHVDSCTSRISQLGEEIDRNQQEQIKALQQTNADLFSDLAEKLKEYHADSEKDLSLHTEKLENRIYDCSKKIDELSKVVSENTNAIHKAQMASLIAAAAAVLSAIAAVAVHFL